MLNTEQLALGGGKIYAFMSVFSVCIALVVMIKFWSEIER